MNPYKILGIPTNSSDIDIKKAYKKMAAKWHPDKNPHRQKQAEEKFKEISNAYNSLTNPEHNINNLNEFNSNFDSFFNDPFFSMNDNYTDLFFNEYNNKNLFSELGRGYRLRPNSGNTTFKSTRKVTIIKNGKKKSLYQELDCNGNVIFEKSC